jgi:hypothetical protein
LIDNYTSTPYPYTTNEPLQEFLTNFDRYDTREREEGGGEGKMERGKEGVCANYQGASSRVPNHFQSGRKYLDGGGNGGGTPKATRSLRTLPHRSPK